MKRIYLKDSGRIIRTESYKYWDDPIFPRLVVKEVTVEGAEFKEVIIPLHNVAMIAEEK